MDRAGRTPPASLTAEVRVDGRDFTFTLFTRPLRLGDSATIRYYWMDSSGFRIARGRRAADPANFRNCVGHWWAAMRSQGWDRDPAQIRHLILATCYPLVSRGNALQHVYRDAHLAPGATNPAEQSLPEDVARRITEAVAGREADRIRGVLDDVLGGIEVPAGEAVAVRTAIDGILGHGEELVRRRGEEGLHEFVGKFDAWCATRRKKGGQGWLRRCLDVLTYECKVSFYRCYANTWIDLIPWLGRHRDLDPTGERFLRFWHMQNQPAERPDGGWTPDVFRGQVLSLHPLSGFFMKDPALCAIAGQFFATDAYDRVFEAGRGETCTEYWDLVGAILTAAALYRQAAEAHAGRRGVWQRAGDDPATWAVADGGPTADSMLEEFARVHGLRCEGCAGPLRSRGFDPVGSEADIFDALYACGGCGQEARHPIGRADLERGLSPPG